jgi:hypothetical protein
MARQRAHTAAPESQQMLALSCILEKLKNGNLHMQRFRETIVADQKQLNGLLAKRKLEA